MGAFSFPSAAACIALAIAAALAGCTGGKSGTDAAQLAAAGPTSGLQITDTIVGTGFSPHPGQLCIVHYTGWLYVNGAKGAKFDSSVDRKKPFSFVLGQHGVIDGWERGVSTMRVGGKRTIIIPPELGYGSQGKGSIPPNATLIFDIELLDVKAP